MRKWIFSGLMLLIVCIVFASCENNTPNPQDKIESPATSDVSISNKETQTADSMINRYVKAIIDNDVDTLWDLTDKSAGLNQKTFQNEWTEVKVRDVRILEKDIRKARGFATIFIDFEDVGYSNFSKSNANYFVWLTKENGSWCVSVMTQSEKPDDIWLDEIS